ncbi:hypothetical protein BO94DRAFT_535176 [Aspergillus sclerotioniger CBS 115572]|uniref:Uncharacterized protein n=1 Tax=Aspergillus sclerotioniger CBS 115572 TaxID=1450535 RepID=A0A317WS98_9EURO|nr:hypothetical protein BO94DRAFT_535176 [Aspergillus sclerotioniger CBS 115572]PWY87060.1 hypothetical protein BO94DRAFT_535176 [Aspergillus sclerotioniger CBS 115572]
MNPAAIAKGLITFANLELYNKACITFPPPPDYVLPKEDIAIQVLENVLNKVVFVGEEYSTVFVNSQIPPHENSSWQADLAINYLTEERKLRILCFIEGKRTSRRQSYITKAVEEEALDYCKEFLVGNATSASFVYAGTLVGVHLRLWIVHREDMSLTPLWGSPYLGSNEDYRDLGVDSHGQEILEAFHVMIRVAPQPWFGSSKTGVIPSYRVGAIQLPRIDRPDISPQSAPLLPSVSVDPGIPGPPAGYVRVTKFLMTTDSYAWMTSLGTTSSGRASEWAVERGYLLNQARHLYADSATENVPIAL